MCCGSRLEVSSLPRPAPPTHTCLAPQKQQVFRSLGFYLKRLLYPLPCASYSLIAFSFSLRDFENFNLQSNLSSWMSPILNSLVLDQVVCGKNVSVFEQNFSSCPDSSFMLITCIVSHMSFRWQKREHGSMSMIQFLNKWLLEQPSGMNKFENQGSTVIAKIEAFK